jgi:hypothetical protein
MVPCTLKKRSSTRIVRIYALVCPFENKVKYIGKTIYSLRHRLIQHMSQKSGSDAKKEWILKLKNTGNRPEIKLLEIVNPEDNWQTVEQYWISKYGLENLLNDNIGGAGGNINHHTNSIYFNQFKCFLLKNYKKNSIKNYLSVVSVFLKEIKFDRPRNITSECVLKYLERYKSPNNRNAAICALKLFYTEIIKQPHKFKNIKFDYNGYTKRRKNLCTEDAK